VGEYVSGAERDNAHGYPRAANPLNHVKDGAIPAAYDDTVEAFSESATGLCACSTRLTGLEDFNRSSGIAKSSDNACYSSPLRSFSLKYWVDEKQDLSHERLIVLLLQN
jgi:hypothetical protein